MTELRNRMDEAMVLRGFSPRTRESYRHAFATHPIEAGVDLPTVQGLLGHGHISTTMRYIHLARSHLTGTTSPLDLLDAPKR